ncbi:MAG: Cys-Gln thioester bond-forming surface protein [Clostridioides sp.]|jgi:hypothetical protein|nr:Cys-Gln thioester bond-forming surface protein [Clostridioides sp.]
MRKHKVIKKGLSLLTALLMVLSGYLGIFKQTVEAADKQEVFLSIYPRPVSSENGDWRGYDDWKTGLGHTELKYLNGWDVHENRNGYWTKSVKSQNGPVAYCIETGAPLNTGTAIGKLSEKDETYWDNYPNTLNDVLTPSEIKLNIGRVLQYGFTENNSTDWRPDVKEDMEKLADQIATQLLVWETQVGERNPDFSHNDAKIKGKNNVLDQIKEDNPLRKEILEHYDAIVTSVQNHIKIPSFMRNTVGESTPVKLTADQSGGYSYAFIDENKISDKFDFTATEGATVTVDQDKVTVHIAKEPTTAITITAKKKDSVRKGIVVWSDGEFRKNADELANKAGNIQDVITYSDVAIPDEIRGHATAQIEKKVEDSGSIKIVKVDSADNKIKLSGAVFDLYCVKDNNLGQFKEIEKGVYEFKDLPLGEYKVKESKSPDGYVLDGKTYTVKIEKAGQVVIISNDEGGTLFTNTKECEKKPEPPCKEPPKEEPPKEQPSTPSTPGTTEKPKEVGGSSTAPKTGEDNSMKAVYAVAGLALLGLAIGGVVGIKNKFN